MLTLLRAAAFSSAGAIADSSDDQNDLLKGCTHVDVARELLNHLCGAPLRTALQNVGGEHKACRLDVAVLDGITGSCSCCVSEGSFCVSGGCCSSCMPGSQQGPSVESRFLGFDQLA